ncbi:putative glutathione S-transferase [Heterostelium album PN500]|uniref:Putative glutathione S-transferase n=1 Tax=Heterostelium pallidum (strain ATCC 26659 / Pp 5 / PN500) TaxID=670386 RepID=D3BF32_HETP5|nr:putative glutathione S-transferase [Heterostelium album PN500]EFA80513.1 putative glutathione S-transferase [Heterostelium album PN500]|eukprot:XP_020432633.1 putative glutathione S-transferase [Heterostelium album PN500]
MATTDSKFITIPATHIQFRRPESAFRNTISKDGPFTPEAGRYHLYISSACPWSDRTALVRKLKGLEDVIGLSVTDWFLGSEGWHFSERQDCIPDNINHFTHVKQLYLATDPQYAGRITVPVLWDKKTSQVVNNESSEIIRMFNSQFQDVCKNPQLDLCPSDLVKEIDELNSYVYDNVNNGVYKCGFAPSQEAYDMNFKNLFEALDKLEERLSKSRYLVGNRFSEADIRLFVTLIRFDPVYFGHFKCNKRQIKDYPALCGYVCDIYQMPPVKSTVNIFHIKHHYYESHRQINPTGIVPDGPLLDYLEQPHTERAKL